MTAISIGPIVTNRFSPFYGSIEDVMTPGGCGKVSGGSGRIVTNTARPPLA